MHVLVLPSWYPTTERPQNGLYFVDQAAALARAGLRVGVLYPELQSLRHGSLRRLRRKHFQYAFHTERGLPTLRQYGWNVLWRSPLRFDLRIWMAERLARRYVARMGIPDVVHAHSARWAAAAAARIGTWLSRPYVVTEHFSGFRRGILSARERRLAREGFGQAAAVLAVSASLRGVLETTGMVPGGRIQVVPNMVDDALFTRPPAPREAAPFRFFALGHLHPWKGYHVLLDAFHRAFADAPHVRLTIGGDGPEAERLQRQARRQGLAGRVTFCGAMTRPAVRDALWASNAFVHSSFQETKHGQADFTIEHGLPTLRRYGWNVLWRAPLRHRLRIRMAQRLTRRYIEHLGRPDLVHVQSVRWAGVAAARIEREHGIPYVVTEHFSGFRRSSVSSHELDLAQRGFEAAQHVAAVSTRLRRTLDARDLVDRDRVRIVPNMVDTRFFRLPPEERRPRPFRFFALAHLQPWKGMEVLLRAFARSFRSAPEVQLTIGGDGPERERLRALARRLSIAPQVTFAGRLTRRAVRAALWQANAFVHPSFEETFGVVLIEAMATGLPVVATACGGPEDIVTSATGTLVPPRDAEAFARAMQELYDTVDRYDPTRIRQYAMRQFGTDAFIRRVTSMYDAALS